jgi:hexosaminidase
VSLRLEDEMRMGLSALTPSLIAIVLASPAVAAPALTPAPAAATEAAGTFPVRDGIRVVVPRGDKAAADAAQFLIDMTAKAGGPKLVLAPGGSAKGAIVLRRGPTKLSGDEAYSLQTTPGGVTLTAAHNAGFARGAASLWQLVTADASRAIPSLTLEDAPRFAWRGLMLDSARHYQSPAFIKATLDVMAAYKLNVFHWHLTDDQAWRLEIKAYPRLTEVGAWRTPAGQGAAQDIDPATGKPRLYGGFYTQDQVREIVAYAAARGITVVPEIDIPGHASAAIAAYPQLASVPNPPRAVPADWGVYPAIFNTDEGTMRFFEGVLDEVMALFPSTYIHLGGDEAVKDQWKASPAVQARIRELGLKDEHALQGWMVRRLEKKLAANGRRLIGWDEILETDVPTSATIMSWRGLDGGIAAARKGHDAVLSPAPLLYLDNRQSPSIGEPPGRGAVVRLQDVYAFDPAPGQLTPEEQRHILGLQGNLWTEHVRTEARTAHMAFPRAIAVAELGWSPRSVHDWADFSKRAQADVARLNRMGYPAANSAWRADPPPGETRRESRELTACSSQILLALEDDAPVRGDRAIFLVDIMNPCWTWPQAQLDGVTRLKVSVGQVPFNFQIGDDVKKIPLAAPRTPAGELEVRVGGCTGEPVAVAPLTVAARNPEITDLTLPLPATRGARDLCFTFTRASVDPVWTVGAVELLK